MGKNCGEIFGQIILGLQKNNREYTIIRNRRVYWIIFERERKRRSMDDMVVTKPTLSLQILKRSPFCMMWNYKTNQIRRCVGRAGVDQSSYLLLKWEHFSYSLGIYVRVSIFSKKSHCPLAVEYFKLYDTLFLLHKISYLKFVTFNCSCLMIFLLRIDS